MDENRRLGSAASRKMIPVQVLRPLMLCRAPSKLRPSPLTWAFFETDRP